MWSALSVIMCSKMVKNSDFDEKITFFSLNEPPTIWKRGLIVLNCAAAVCKDVSYSLLPMDKNVECSKCDYVL